MFGLAAEALNELDVENEPLTMETEKLIAALRYCDAVVNDTVNTGSCNFCPYRDHCSDLDNEAADLIESMQSQLAAERIKYAELQRYNVDCTKACDRQMVEILELREQSAQLSNARNELCQRCGRYREAHKGACDGCRWKELQNVLVH